MTRWPTDDELHLIRTRLDPAGARDRGAAMIRTRLTELLGIRHPVVQAAMGTCPGPRLAAATSNAGGLGMFASATMSLAELARPSPRRPGGPARRSG